MRGAQKSRIYREKPAGGAFRNGRDRAYPYTPAAKQGFTGYC